MVITLDGNSLAGALRAGTSVVLRERDYLNKINFFPVPDADTGTNLAATLVAVARRFAEAADPEAGKVAVAAADAALGGARGNSGAIFAQFLHGFAQHVKDLVHIDTKQFASAAKAGVDAAYKAIFQPREGTILSVLRSWAEECGRWAHEVTDFKALIPRTIGFAQNALALTTKQLDVLAKNKVVDAGGQGFLYFLNGISDFLHGKISHETLAKDALLVIGEETEPEHPAAGSGYAYCTEALLEGRNLDADEITRAVSPLGDSLVVAGGGNRLKVHVHTDVPRRFYEIVGESGYIERSKVEDMRIMQIAERREGIGFVIDSTCDIDEEKIAGKPVYRVPLTISIGDEEFRDGFTISPTSFYQRMKRESSGIPLTSQPSAGAFAHVYERLLERHDEIISIHVIGRSSGTVQSATAAAKQIDASRIHVIDTLKVSAGIAYLLEDALRMAEKGESVSSIVDAVEAARDDIRILATTPTLEYAVRGGRVNARVGKVLEFFGLKPIILFDEIGKAHKAGVSFGFERALQNLVSRAASFAKKRRASVKVAHADNATAATKLANMAAEKFELEEVEIIQAGAVLGAHVGPGGVALIVRRI